MSIRPCLIKISLGFWWFGQIGGDLQTPWGLVLVMGARKYHIRDRYPWCGIGEPCLGVTKRSSVIPHAQVSGKWPLRTPTVTTSLGVTVGRTLLTTLTLPQFENRIRCRPSKRPLNVQTKHYDNVKTGNDDNATHLNSWWFWIEDYSF